MKSHGYNSKQWNDWNEPVSTQLPIQNSAINWMQSEYPTVDPTIDPGI